MSMQHYTNRMKSIDNSGENFFFRASKRTIPISSKIFSEKCAMPLSPPASIEREHAEMWKLLLEVQHISGKTGSVAERLAKGLKSHIDKEETLALPLLGLLQDIVKGKLSKTTARRAAKIYAQFEKEYAGMLQGHREIDRFLIRLRIVGAEEGHLTAIRFADFLERHAREEEDVFYPAALLAGRFASSQVKSKR